MMHDVKVGRKVRKSFSKIDEVLTMPNLIEVQKGSYENFLREGLQEAFADISPITDYTGKLVLELTNPRIEVDNPKYSIEECKIRDVNYAAPMRVTAQLVNTETGEIKGQEVFMGDFPLMTPQGTFIINGAERVIVSQLLRSPGVYYTKTVDPKSGENLFFSQIIPNRGAWLEYETDANNVLYVKIDRQRKIWITSLLRAFMPKLKHHEGVEGVGSDAEIVALLGDDDRLQATLGKDGTHSEEDALLEIYRRQRPGEPLEVTSARNLLYGLFFERRYDLARVGRYKYNKKLALRVRIAGHVADEAVIDPTTGEILVEEGAVISAETAAKIQAAGINEVYLRVGDDNHRVKVVGNFTAPADGFLPFAPIEAGLNEEVYLPVLWDILAGEDYQALADDAARKEFLRLRYHDLIPNTITADDVLASCSYIIGLPYGIGTTDDIDHLGNRRIRSVGELLQNQVRMGLSRLERVVRERMGLAETDSVMPSNLINIRPVTAAIKEFFGSSQLSQFMDQTNPLSELTHKRRLSALGPGGLNRERATFEVRDVHYSHYGRMCPIETPEGPNSGLINSLATFARINEYGFIESPYRKVK